MLCPRILLVSTNNCKEATILSVLKDKKSGLMLKTVAEGLSKTELRLSLRHRLSA